VWPGAFKTFDVALAETLKSEFVKGEGIKILEEVKYPVRVEPKLDGLRCIAIKRDGKVTFFTRNGTELDSMPKIKEELEDANFDNVVLDGEGMGADWNESASVMMSKTQKDDSNLYYNVFDAMPLTDWVNQECSMPYIERSKIVHEIILACVDFAQNSTSHVYQVPHIMAKNEDELNAYFQRCMNDGYEGVMLKTLDTPYKFKRSKNILKLKPCVTYEGVIVAHYEGRRGTKREGLFGGFEVVLPNGVITKVGGGFNDALKASIQLEGPDAFLGKIVEIEAQPDPLTKDGLTVDGCARFPVFCRFRDESDVDPKVITAGVKFFETLNS
jgi:DNA ligase-1